MNFLTSLINRPIATSMFFAALVLLGVFSLFRLPVELIPAMSGEKLYVAFHQPSADATQLEREILTPLESRIKTLRDVTQIRGVIGSELTSNGLQGLVTVEFEPGTNRHIRELELKQIAAQIEKNQPQGTSLNVSSKNTAALSRFVASIQVTSRGDVNALRQLVEQQIQPKLEQLGDVAQVFVRGGSQREVSVRLDRLKMTEFNVTTEQVYAALTQRRTGMVYLGNARNGNGLIHVIQDDNQSTVAALANTPLFKNRDLKLHHVAEVAITYGEQRGIYRVNGVPAVGMLIFHNEGANLIELGQALRTRLAQLNTEFSPHDIQFLIDTDAAAQIEDQITHLKAVALSGFFIAIVVLLLFLRQWGAVIVLGISVPVCLLITCAVLYLGDYSLNIYTILGLVIVAGMLVDNSIVVYEAVQKKLEAGYDAKQATTMSVRMTGRAIITASATNAIVFLPLLYLDDIPFTMQSMIENIVPAVLIPLFSSLITAVALVPLLSYQISIRLPKSNQATQGQQSNLLYALIQACLKVALRKPTYWLTSIFTVIVVTLVVALPWVLIQTVNQSSATATQIRFEIAFMQTQQLASTNEWFQSLELRARRYQEITKSVSSFQQDSGYFTVYLDTQTNRSTVTKIKSELGAFIKQQDNTKLVDVVTDTDSPKSDDNPDKPVGSVEVAISGPEMTQLWLTIQELKKTLTALPFIDEVTIQDKPGVEELTISANNLALSAYNISLAQVFSSLSLSGREGLELLKGMPTASGRELPVVIRIDEVAQYNVVDALLNTQVNGGNHALAINEFVTLARNTTPSAIQHIDGRRELSLYYKLNDAAPQTGPARQALERAIQDSIQNIHRPPGYTVTVEHDNNTKDWLDITLLPILFLLFFVLALSFESLTLPLLILLSAPLTAIGAVWGLVFFGLGFDSMAFIGIVVLLGLTVNPAILLVDLIQQKVSSSNLTTGFAVMRAVKERTRPVLLTSCTTIAGLYPLTQPVETGFSFWPPFAVVMIGGLLTSTLLTLLLVPVGYTLLKKAERMCHMIGYRPYLYTLAILLPLVLAGHYFSVFRSQAELVFSLIIPFLIVSYFLWRRTQQEDLLNTDIRSEIETRYLSKTYGRANTLQRAVLKHTQHNFAESRTTLSSFVIDIVLLSTLSLIFYHAHSWLWQAILFFALTTAVTRFLRKLSTVQNRIMQATPLQHLNSASLQHTVFFVIGIMILLLNYAVMPMVSQSSTAYQLALILGVALGLRYMCCRCNYDAPDTWFARLTRHALNLLGFTAHSEFRALSSIHLKAHSGMIGVIGPNGAGKTTFFRLLANIYAPTAGTVYFNGRKLAPKHPLFSKIIGFLPQEFGLPGHMTAQDYLRFYAHAYQIGDRYACERRVEELLDGVGLWERRQQEIDSFSGGMKQRVAIARTLLGNPPVVIVDEPTVGLDPRERVRFRNLLQEQAKKQVVFFSTHVIEDIATSCDRVIAINKGQLVFDGAPGELAALSKDKVWELIVPVDQVEQYEHQFHIINQIPQANNMSLIKIYSESKPATEAQPLAPVLEDGYVDLLYEKKQPHCDTL